MTLGEFPLGIWCRVISVHTDEATKRRLTALRFGEGERIRVVRISPLKRTLLLEGVGRISLRREQANEIEVEECK
ncbi:MAG: ferrous iron transport protein A [Clostridia bacterium]|nr:ferrous iron transport protein A [Clostridia bacterium]